MKKLFVLFFILIVGCTNQKIHIKKQTIKELSAFNFSLPSSDIDLFLFVKSSGGNICSLNIVALHNIYIQVYSKSKMDFNAFLSSALNETMSVDNGALKKNRGFEFNIDKKIMDDYTNWTFSRFESKYCDIENKNRALIKKQYKKNTGQLYSIMYYFFINSYKVLPNEYLGEYVIIK